MKVDDVFDDTTNASTTQLPSGSQPGADKAKKPPIIRKRFKWTEEIKYVLCSCLFVLARCALFRKLLCAAVKVKVACEERANKMPKANAEETIMVNVLKFCYCCRECKWLLIIMIFILPL